MDPLCLPAGVYLSRLPRLRGDGPDRGRSESGGLGAAPPTRGWTQIFLSHIERHLGCPAYAGMDPDVECSLNTVVGLPRLRGDGPPIQGRGRRA